LTSGGGRQSSQDGFLPRRVLHVMNNAQGGAAESTLSIIEGLREHGVESSVMCHRSGDPAGDERLVEAVEGRCRFETLWSWNRRIRLAPWRRVAVDLREGARTGRGRRSVRAVTEFAASQGVDLVHSNTVLVPEGAWTARALELPHVWHLRELVGPGHPYRFWRESRFVPDRLMPSGEVLVANSHVAAEAARSMTRPPTAFDEARVFVVRNGIEVERFADLPPRSGDDRLVVGMVANLTSRWKQHDLFIDAVATVEPALPVRYVMVGLDPYREGLPDPYAEALHRRVLDLGLADRFEFVGAVSDPARIMAMLDVLVHPCGQESFGRVTVEAMAAGRAVVAVRAGGSGEVVRHDHSGLLVPPDDPTAMGEAIVRLATDPEKRAALGAAGRLEAVEHFGADRLIEGVLAAYRHASTTVMAGRDSRRRGWVTHRGGD
jgi:glycosyltransferase involved in cell wall biosynthesis